MAGSFLGGDGVQVALQDLGSLTFEIHECYAVAKLGMTGDDESPDEKGSPVEPEGSPQADADGERNHQLDVTAAAAEVGGFEAQGDIAAVWADLDGNVDRIARMLTALE